MSLFINKRTKEIKELLDNEVIKGADWLLVPSDCEMIVYIKSCNVIAFYRDGAEWVAGEDRNWVSSSSQDFELDIAGEHYEILWGGLYGYGLKKSDKSKTETQAGIKIEDIQVVEADNDIKVPVKSDGGSSGYYFTKLPQHLIDQIVETGGIEIKDIVRYCFYNDADCKDIIKALKRIEETKRGGGKVGATIEYDLNKIKFFSNEALEAYLNEQKN